MTRTSRPLLPPIAEVDRVYWAIAKDIGGMRLYRNLGRWVYRHCADYYPDPPRLLAKDVDGRLVRVTVRVKERS